MRFDKHKEPTRDDSVTKTREGELANGSVAKFSFNGASRQFMVGSGIVITLILFPLRCVTFQGNLLKNGIRPSPGASGSACTMVGGDHDEHAREPAPSRFGETRTSRGAAWCSCSDRCSPGEWRTRPATCYSSETFRWTGRATFSIPRRWATGRATLPTPRRRRIGRATGRTTLLTPR